MLLGNGVRLEAAGGDTAGPGGGSTAGATGRGRYWGRRYGDTDRARRRGALLGTRDWVLLWLEEGDCWSQEEVVQLGRGGGTLDSMYILGDKPHYILKIKVSKRSA